MVFLKSNSKTHNIKERKWLWLFLSFVLPFIIMILGCVALHITPFGEHSLVISDGDSYVNSLSYFKRMISGQESFLYSFEYGLGNNMVSYFSWGQLSPVYLLIAFARLETIPVWFTWISITSMALCGLTMYILLDQVHGHRVSNLIFSTSYALIGFSVVNDFQIIFFAGVQMLPLVILGLYRMMKGKNPALYIISLGYCILVNFYFGYMLCIFSILFFIVQLIVHKKEWLGTIKKRIGTFIFSSFLGGLIPSFIWLPAIKAMMDGGRISQTDLTEFSFSENMPFLEIFAKLFTGANSTSEIVSGLPNIFCGILVIALVILYFLKKTTPKQHKIAAACCIGFYLLSFYIVAFTMAMHGFTHTNWFPYRYSFIFSFILITIAAEQFRRLEEVTLKDTYKVAAIIVAAAIIIFSKSYEFISGGCILIDLALLFIMWIGFYIYKKKPKISSIRVLSIFLIIVVAINLYANYVISTYKVQDYEISLSDYADSVMTDGSLTEAITMADDSFYRIENENAFTGSLGTDSILYGYDGVGGSGPVIRQSIHQELAKIGINWFDMRHYYSEGIAAATDSLLGVKYIIAKNDIDLEKGYTRKIALGDKSIFVNENTLPIAILSNSEVQNIENGYDVFENLNKIYKSMTGGKDDIYTEESDITYTSYYSSDGRTVTSEELKESTSKAESETEAVSEETELVSDDSQSASGEVAEEEETDSYIEYSFTASKDGTIYMYDTSIPASDDGNAAPAIKCCGTYKKGDTVTGKINIYGDYLTISYMNEYCSGLVFAYEDIDVLNNYCKQLNSRDISITKEEETLLDGEFTADSDQCILFTIPWDEGWTCYIDGQKADINKTWNLFMSVNVPEGTHTYKMVYFPAWMKTGIIISIVAFIVFIVYAIWFSKRRKRLALVSAEVDESVELVEEKAASDEPENPESEEAASDEPENLESEKSALDEVENNNKGSASDEPKGTDSEQNAASKADAEEKNNPESKEVSEDA